MITERYLLEWEDYESTLSEAQANGYDETQHASVLDFAEAIQCFETFGTFEEAHSRGVEVLRDELTCFGCFRVYHQERHPRYDIWEDVADPRLFSAIVSGGQQIVEEEVSR